MRNNAYVCASCQPCSTRKYVVFVTGRFGLSTDFVRVVTIYIMCVRLGSGRSVTMSSNGIFIDETPPEIQELYHLDLPYDPDEPTEYQGQNHTIAVMLDTLDNESEVREQWSHMV